ncbi:MAG: hypothetical protein AABY93_16035 [Bacteroidota bacterium]
MKKFQLSDKDYLLALGILVAVIIMLTTLVYTDVPKPETKNGQPPQQKTGLYLTPSVLLKKVVEKVDFKSLIQKNP